MSVTKLSSLAVAANKEDGDWEDCPTIPGVKFQVRPITYPPFAIARDHHMQRLRRKYGESIPPNVMSPTLGRLAADHLLLGWEGFDEEWSKGAAADLLTNPDYSELVSAVLAAAISAGSAKLEYVDGTAKN